MDISFGAQVSPIQYLWIELRKTIRLSKSVYLRFKLANTRGGRAWWKRQGSWLFSLDKRWYAGSCFVKYGMKQNATGQQQHNKKEKLEMHKALFKSTSLTGRQRGKMELEKIPNASIFSGKKNKRRRSWRDGTGFQDEHENIIHLLAWRVFLIRNWIEYNSDTPTYPHMYKALTRMI